MIARYGPCWGITIFRWFRLKVELWVSPKEYATPEHAHDLSDGEFLVLYGKKRTIWRVVDGIVESYQLTGKFKWKWFTVRAGTPHGFSCGESLMVWIVTERWAMGSPVTSVAKDFRLT